MKVDSCEVATMCPSSINFLDHRTNQYLVLSTPRLYLYLKIADSRISGGIGVDAVCCKGVCWVRRFGFWRCLCVFRGGGVRELVLWDGMGVEDSNLVVLSLEVHSAAKSKFKRRTVLVVGMKDIAFENDF